MALTVEDGSIVANANTYLSRAAAIAYAADRGVTLADSTATDAMILQAMDWLAQFLARWKGYLVSELQELPFPRGGIDTIGVGGSPGYLPDDAIPGNLIEAQAQLVIAIKTGVLVVGGTASGLAVIKDKIGPIETQYATPKQMGAVSWQTADMPTVNALLEPLLASGFRLKTLRV